MKNVYTGIVKMGKMIYIRCGIWSSDEGMPSVKWKLDLCSTFSHNID